MTSLEKSNIGCGCSYCEYLRSIIEQEESKLQVYRDELKRNHVQFKGKTKLK